MPPSGRDPQSADARPPDGADPDRRRGDTTRRRSKSTSKDERWEDDYVGQQLGDCRLVRVLQSSKLSSVFEGFHERLAIKVAVKVYRKQRHATAKALMRFYTEARQAARLDHPNIVRVINVDSTDECHFLVMQLVEGETLGQLLKREGTLPPEQVANLLLQALEGLAYAHRKGLIHRDIKPDNLMVNSEGKLKITDFGLAREVGVTAPIHPNRVEADIIRPGEVPGNTGRKRPRTVAGQMLGTPYYMPHEQWEDAGSIDRRADIYALGVTAYQLLSGKLPYSGKNPVAVLGQIIKGTRKPITELVPSVDPTFGAIIDRMMAPEKNARYPRAEDVIEDLRFWAASRNGGTLDSHETGLGLGTTLGGGGTTSLVTPATAEPLARSGDSYMHFRLAGFLTGTAGSEIWHAVNTGTGEDVLLKILRDPRALDRLRNSASFVQSVYRLGRLGGVLAIRDVVTDHQPPFIVFEKPAGHVLKDYLREHGPMGEPRVVEVLIGVAEVLSRAHADRVIHGDLRDANVLVAESGDEVQVTVFNFGLLSDLDAHPLALRLGAAPSPKAGSSQLNLAAIDWLAPEVTDGDRPTQRTDLFSLGLLGLFALTGKRPGRNLARQIGNLDISQPLRQLLLRLTDEDPAGRPHDAGEVAKELTQIKLLHVLGEVPPDLVREARMEDAAETVMDLPDTEPPAHIRDGVDAPSEADVWPATFADVPALETADQPLPGELLARQQQQRDQQRERERRESATAGPDGADDDGDDSRQDSQRVPRPKPRPGMTRVSDRRPPVGTPPVGTPPVGPPGSSDKDRRPSRRRPATGGPPAPPPSG